MSLIESAIIRYRQGGLRNVVQKGYLKTLRSNTLEKLIRELFGDIFYERLRMAAHVGYWPHIEDPSSFNEKVYYRKFFTDEKFFSKLEDKWRVRDYVKERVGEDILPEIYHTTTSPKEIPFEDLPEKFVVKANHGCGWNILVDDKANIDFNRVRQQCREWLSKNYGDHDNEYWYSRIEPRILVEEYLENENGNVPRDFKFYVFDGVVEYIHVDFGRNTDSHTRRFYTRDWEPQEFELKYPLGPEMEKPENMDKMIDIAEKLGEDHNFVRVDLYNIDDERIVFGEITIGPGSGRSRLRPKKADFEIGKHWTIRKDL